MTAVTKYQRLECSGLWRASASAQLREVIVALRDATLVLLDPRTAMVLTHWSLPAVERLNPGELPALYTAGRLDDGTPAETLEVSDSDMMAALDTIRVALVRRQPHPGRLRGVFVVAVLTAVAMVSILWLPGAMTRHTASVLPQATRVQLGKLALADLTRLTGSPCANTFGKRAAATLAQRLSSAGVGEIAVVRDGLQSTVSLPGGLVLVGQPLLEQFPDPEIIAGYALTEAVRAEQRDPVVPLLSHAGLIATLRLLTTGQLPEASVTGYAETLLQADPVQPEEARLLDRFTKVGLATSTFARAAFPEDTTLVESDPFAGKSPTPILSDNDWVSLQGICDG